MRSGNVISPRSASQQSNGFDARPQMLIVALTCGNKSPLPAIMPKVTSLCPPIIFVRLSMTTSAPKSRGRVNTGVAKVLSTISIVSRDLANLPSASMSTKRKSGLDTVSTNSTRAPLSRAVSTWSRSLQSTLSVVTPKRGNS